MRRGGRALTRLPRDGENFRPPPSDGENRLKVHTDLTVSARADRWARPRMRGSGTASKGSCTFAMAFEVSHGTYGTVSLDGLAWEDASGRNNGQYAPFSRRNA
jgi:hypothetical protein